MTERLLILGPKGGGGKSTLARNMAVAAALDGLSVIAVDFDAQRTLTKWGARRAAAAITPAIPVLSAPIADGRDALATLPACELVVCDTPPAVEEHPAAFKGLILWATLVLIPARPSPDDVDSVVEFMPLVQDLGKPTAFVLNAARPRVRETTGARRKLGRHGDVLAAALPDSVEIQRAMAEGRGVLETNGRGADDSAALWAEVRRRLGLAMPLEAR